MQERPVSTVHNRDQNSSTCCKQWKRTNLDLTTTYSSVVPTIN
jgi:hypothetical protein